VKPVKTKPYIHFDKETPEQNKRLEAVTERLGEARDSLS
jgi:hypothetical protein